LLREPARERHIRYIFVSTDPSDVHLCRKHVKVLGAVTIPNVFLFIALHLFFRFGTLNANPGVGRLYLAPLAGGDGRGFIVWWYLGPSGAQGKGTEPTQQGATE
jgi:hypothetical protein